MRGCSFLTVIFAAALLASCATNETTPLASNEDVKVAEQNLIEWIESYEKGDYYKQWRLTDPRIRYWRNIDRWAEGMAKASETNGGLVSLKITTASPIEAEKLPCTEMGHCYRRGVQYIMFLIESEYEIASPPQPEFAVMAKSLEGWRFGGGTILNRPFGESSVILSRRDENRYRPNWTVTN